jgi:UDP-glucose 4-epimerase
MKKKILVTGGTGYIGSHTVTDLLASGYEVISIDNYARSSVKVLDGIEAICGVKIKNYNIDLCNFADTYQVFAENTDIQGIIHFAAYKSVPESVEFPMRYYENNLFSLINVLKCAKDFGVMNIVFSSSCSVYGNVDVLPVTEETPLGKPECAYASTKQMGEQIILDFAKANSDFSTCILRYFNPVGAHQSAEIGEMPVMKPNNLVPLITQTAAGLHEKMYVWGSDYDTRDGSCIRDYIHVMDIANAHTKALQFMMGSKHDSNCEIFNLGSGNGVSVMEAIRMFEQVSGQKLNYEIGPRRDGDVVAVYADNEKARQLLGWQTKYSLEDMMRTAWQWQLKCAE